MRSYAVPAVISVLAVCMLLMPLAPAYAAVSSTSVQAPQNGIGIDYLAVAVCSLDGFDEDHPVDSFGIRDSGISISEADPLSASVIATYNTGGAGYVVDITDSSATPGRVSLSSINTFVYIDDGTTDSVYTVRFQLTSTATGYDTLVFHMECFADGTDAGSGETLTLTSGTAVRIRLSAEIGYDGSTVPENIPLDFSVTSVLDSSNTSLLDPGKHITLQQGSIVNIVAGLNSDGDGSTFVVYPENQIPSESNWPGGENQDTTYVVTEVGGYTQAHPGCEAVNVLGNPNGLAKDNHVNMSFQVPNNKRFAIEFVATTNVNGDKLSLKVTYYKADGTEDHHYGAGTINLLSKKSTIVGKSGNNPASGQVLDSVDYLGKKDQTHNPGGIDWFEPGGTGTVNLTLSALGAGKPVNNTVKMYLVFSDMPATP